MWLGLRGRRWLEILQGRIDDLTRRQDELQKQFRDLDAEMSAHVDRLIGVAKRIQGRRGGRPPNGEAKPEADEERVDETPPGFSRHVL